MSIYCKVEKKENVREFLIACSTASGRFCKTYYDEMCIQEQCHEAWRSFDEIYDLCTGRYPNISVLEFAKLFVNMTKEGEIGDLGNCGDIKKPVFGLISHDIRKDAFVIDYKGNAKYSRRDILIMAGEEVPEIKINTTKLDLSSTIIIGG